MEQTPIAQPATVGAAGVATAPTQQSSGCPVVHAHAPETATGGCPFPHGAASGVQRSRADLVARRVLRVRERPAGVTAAAAYVAFQRSMLISATRCTLTYVVFPFVIPAIGFAAGVGPALGILIGVVAMVCDVFAIRRFFAVDHRWRWPFTVIVLCVIGLLSVLLVQDVRHFLG